MFTDITNKRRLKVGLHTHTTLSDGRKPPEEAAAIYKAAGYDALAITDHWNYYESGEIDGLTILSGCEYNVCGMDGKSGIMETYHIVGVGMTRKPDIPADFLQSGPLNVKDGHIREMVRILVRAIRDAGGLAVLAHPAWSVNTPEQIIDCWDFDATEIYNSVSECGESDRPYSGVIVDQLALNGKYLPLLATDDTHHYDDDACRGFVMVEADAVEELGMVEAIRQGRFYASQGPEVHLERVSPAAVKVVCSPAVKIVLDSNLPWSLGHVLRGEGLTEHTYQLDPRETFIRAEVTDAEGRVAYSNIIPL